MTEMRLDPSDFQVQRHAIGQMAEIAGILRDELDRVGFEIGLRDDLVLEWWKLLVGSSLQPKVPDLAEIVKLLGIENNEEE